MSVRTDEGLEGEGDFVIAIPDRGFLVLEVKGGLIEQRDGRWFQNSQPMEHSPRSQGHSFAQKLSSRLPAVNGMTVPYGILTIFPDTPSSELPAQDNLRDLVLTERDVVYLKDAITAKLDKAFPDNFVVPECNWSGALHALWGESWIPKVHLGHKKQANAEERYQLDQRQVEIIAALAGNKRLRIEGVAGSGKTVMAREAALRMAGEGQKVQILCFTDALAKWLAFSLKETDIQVATVPRFAAELMLGQGQTKALPSDPESWADISLRAASDALPLLQERPDVVIVDEAQDLDENEWLLIEELAKDAKVWIFHDPAQAFWENRKLPDWVADLSSYRLIKCYRCPEPIMEYSNALGGLEHDEALVQAGFEQETLARIECPSESSIPAKIENEIRKLLSRGFEPGDIAVLSLRGRSAESVAGQDKIGSFPVVRADSPDIDENIVADTFLRFKGLERPAIIVTDLRLVKDRFDVRMHIALSRALDVVRVVGKTGQ